MIPIALGLAWPDRVPDAAPAFDWSTPGTWEFFPLDDEAFPAVSLARTAGGLGGTAPAVYNAANEECVEAFRAGRLRFVDIIPTVDAVLAAHDVRSGAPHRGRRPRRRCLGARGGLRLHRPTHDQKDAPA